MPTAEMFDMTRLCRVFLGAKSTRVYLFGKTLSHNCWISIQFYLYDSFNYRLPQSVRFCEYLWRSHHP